MLKEELYRLCFDFINKREEEIKKLIAEARDASNNETKSSAGDKYETARELMQQQINLNLARLNDLGKLRTALDHITPTQTGTVAMPGSIVYTNNGNFPRCSGCSAGHPELIISSRFGNGCDVDSLMR